MREREDTPLPLSPAAAAAAAAAADEAAVLAPPRLEDPPTQLGSSPVGEVSRGMSWWCDGGLGLVVGSGGGGC